MTRETIKAIGAGLLATLLLAVLIIIGSRNLSHFDAALVGYTFAELFASFGVTYRYAMWLQHPPTVLYWKRGWQVFLRPKYLARNVAMWFARVTYELGLNHFITRRGAPLWIRKRKAAGLLMADHVPLFHAQPSTTFRQLSLPLLGFGHRR